MSTRIVFVTLLSAALLSSCSSPSDIGPAPHQRIVSKEVGPFLNEAKAMADDKDYKGAMAKADEAEAVKSTLDDSIVINQMRRYIEIKSASSDAKANFFNAYSAAKFKDALAYAAAFQNQFPFDPEITLMVAQAYYKAGDLSGCAKYIRENPYLSRDPMVGGRYPAAELLERCQ